MRTSVIALAAVCVIAAPVIIISTKKESSLATGGKSASKSLTFSGICKLDTVKQPAKEKIAIQSQAVKPVQFSKCNLLYVKPPKRETAVVTGTTDTTIRFSQGTELKINPSDFVSELTDQPIAGPVKLQVTEHYNMEDILLNDLSTATKNGMLETNGMINIQAFAANGQVCKLKKNGSVEIHFPKNNNKPGMQLFSASKDKSGNIIWEPMIVKANSTPTQVGKMSSVKAIDTATNPKTPAVIDTNLNTLPQFPGGLIGIEKNINTVKNKFPFLDDNAVVICDFNISVAGEVCWVGDVRNNSGPYAEALNEALFKMPAWKPALVKGKPKMMTMRLTVSFSKGNLKLMKFWSCIKSPSQNNRRVFDYGYSNTEMGYTKKETDVLLSNYVFTSTSLGWINCDRFYSSPQPKIQLYVQEPAEDNTTLKMVFHSIRAVLNASFSDDGKFYFSNVPMGEQVTIIALKGDKDHLRMALKTVTISEKPLDKLTYVSVTTDEVRKTMEQFNNLPGAVAKN